MQAQADYSAHRIFYGYLDESSLYRELLVCGGSDGTVSFEAETYVDFLCSYDAESDADGKSKGDGDGKGSSATALRHDDDVHEEEQVVDEANFHSFSSPIY